MCGETLHIFVDHSDYDGAFMPGYEPVDGKHKSQIEEYLDFYLTPGVQHLALSIGDILGAVEKLKRNGIEFLRVPDTDYDMLPERLVMCDLTSPIAVRRSRIADQGKWHDH